MAKLVDLSTTERPTARQPREDIARLRSPGPSEAPGRALMQAGADIQSGANEIFRAQKIEEDRINTLRAEEAYTKLRERQLDLSAGEQTGFTRLKGAAAVTKPIYTEWGKRFQDAQSEIASGLTNDDQREKFKKRADVARLQFNEEILRHLAREGDAYAKEVYDGTIATEKRNAVARWDSPNDVALSLDRIKNAVAESAERFGWAPELREAKLKVESGAVHAAVVQQAIASGDYRYAQAWYNEHRADIDLGTAKQLEKAVEDGTQKELANGYRAQYLSIQDDPRGLDALHRDVMADKLLDDGRRNILIGQIQNRQYVLARRAEVLEERRLRRVERSINELNANTLAGFEPNEEQFTAVLAEAKGTELEGDVRGAMQLAGATRAFRNAPPTQQEKLLAEAEASVRQDPTKFDRKIITAWRSVYDAQQRQAKEDPVTFAVRQGVVEPPAPLDLSQPARMGDALAQRFAIARGVSARYNTPVKPLTEQETSLLRAVLKDAPAEKKSQYFAGLVQASGGDFEGYKSVIAQIAPDDPVTAEAGLHAGRAHQDNQAERGKSRYVSDLILKGQAALRPNRKEDGTPDRGKLWPMPQGKDEQTMRQLFADYENGAYAGREKDRSATYQTALAIYAGKTIDDGDGSGALNPDRWKRAMELATGGIQEWSGKRVVMPWGYSYDQFKDGLYQRIDDVIASGKLDAALGAGRLRDMPLRPIGDGQYVFVSGDSVLAYRDLDPQTGKPIPVVVDFNRPAISPRRIERRFPSLSQK